MSVLEKMDAFFEARLEGYDAHMRSDIAGAAEFYPFTARCLPMGAARILDLGCGTGLELEPYFAENPEAEERLHRQTLLRLKAEAGITGEGLYHYDTPLTVDHEMQILLDAGFSRVEIRKAWGATHTLQAWKEGERDAV